MLNIPTKFDLANEADGLLGEPPNYSQYTQFIEQDTMVTTAEGPFAVLVIDRLTDDDLAPVVPVVQAVKTRVQNRGNAAGKGSMMQRKRKDGFLSRTSTIPPEVSKLLGYSDQLGYLDGSTGGGKTRGTHYCRRSGLTIRHPEYLDTIRPVIRKVDAIFGEVLPVQYAAQVAEIAPAGRMKISPAYSTANLNRDWQTCCHRDAYDLPDGWCAIFALGSYAGGDILIPRFRLRFELRPGNILFFRPHEIHGNLDFLGELLQIVLFGREHIASCGGR